ncbi:CvpA family protein [Pseudomonadota bacterium]|nr:CvpA family protein [Pseudomonadota bacterium]
MDFFEDAYFNIIDIAVISIILISCVVATFRGFVKETFSIVSWLIALIVAFQLYEKFKLELVQYISQKVIVDVIAFGFPFLTTLFISNLISNWLSPKFSVPGLLIFDKLFGLIFGITRGVLFVLLLYLGFTYLLGKEKSLPSIILEAYTFNYVKKTASVLVSFIAKNKSFENHKIIDIDTEVLTEDKLLKDR